MNILNNNNKKFTKLIIEEINKNGLKKENYEEKNKIKQKRIKYDLDELIDEPLEGSKDVQAEPELIIEDLFLEPPIVYPGPEPEVIQM